MKISAEFDTVDSADIAAASLRGYISELYDIRVKNDPYENHTGPYASIFPAYNIVSPSDNPGFSFPFFNTLLYLDSGLTINRDYDVKSPKLEIICRKEDEKAVSRVVIGHGGRNVTKI